MQVSPIVAPASGRSPSINHIRIRRSRREKKFRPPQRNGGPAALEWAEVNHAICQIPAADVVAGRLCGGPERGGADRPGPYRCLRADRAAGAALRADTAAARRPLSLGVDARLLALGRRPLHLVSRPLCAAGARRLARRLLGPPPGRLGLGGRRLALSRHKTGPDALQQLRPLFLPDFSGGWNSRNE